MSASTARTRSPAPAGWILAASAKQAGEGWNRDLVLPEQPWRHHATPPGRCYPRPRNVVAQMTEWNGVAAAACRSTRRAPRPSRSPPPCRPCPRAAATTSAGELVITNDRFQDRGWPDLLPTRRAGPGWSPTTPTASPPSTGSTCRPAIASETVSTDTGQPVVDWPSPAFKPGARRGGAVLDPGFYYFNGSGFAGGGGICLNGGTPAGPRRDPRVRQPGRLLVRHLRGRRRCLHAPRRPASSASDPARRPVGQRAIPWFAAPCSQDPSASPPDASCLGAASWCPTGDRVVLEPARSGPRRRQHRADRDQRRARRSTGCWAPSTGRAPAPTPSTAPPRSPGRLSCGTLSISAAAGAGTAVGGDYGVNTARWRPFWWNDPGALSASFAAPNEH